jgi:cytochrome b subunit of formate dehydrogenase
MHWAVTVVVLGVIVTGVLLFLQIDTPFWDRTNSMPENQLGLVFLLHGLSTLALVALAATHIYFALRPEKLFYTRSMVSGWISEDELKANHDASLWSPKEAD